MMSIYILGSPLSFNIAIEDIMPVSLFWPFGALFVAMGSYFSYQGLNALPTNGLMVAGGGFIAVVFGVLTAISYFVFFRTTATNPKLGKMAPILYTLLIAFFGLQMLAPTLGQL
jgi:hypothetical protein